MIAKIGQTLDIGQRPEHNAREFAFDVAKWRGMWPEATINIVVERPGDKAAYPAISRMDGDKVVWTVTRYDTALPGVGKMWVTFTNGDQLLGMTPPTMIRVDSGAEMIAGETPASDTPPWVQQVLDAIANFTPGEGGNGAPGKDGEDGATFYPSVSEDGTLSWTNNGRLENPEPVNIRGPVGETGPVGPQGPQGMPGRLEEYELLNDVTMTEEAWFVASADSNGRPYDLKRFLLIMETTGKTIGTNMQVRAGDNIIAQSWLYEKANEGGKLLSAFLAVDIENGTLYVQAANTWLEGTSANTINGISRYVGDVGMTSVGFSAMMPVGMHLRVFGVWR